MGVGQIESVFAKAFATWDIRLPAEAVADRKNGSISEDGWSISYVWGAQDGEEYLEYSADHRMTDPSCTRVWESGRVEDMPVPSANMFIPPGTSEAELPDVESAHFDENRAAYDEMRAKGLLPPQGQGPAFAEINEFLESGGMSEGPRSSDAPDQRALFAAAVARTASVIDTSGPKSTFLESRIVRAMESALGEAIGADLVGHERSFPIPDWDPRPGGIDLFTLHSPGGELRVIAEAKVNDVNWCLWDLWKMVSATQLPGVEAAYLVVAASRQHWQSGSDCVDLFPAEAGEPRRWDSLGMIQTWHAAWEELLEGGRGRPLRVARTIEVEFVGCHDIAAFDGYELRAIAVSAVPGGEWLEFDGDWPVGYLPA